MEESQSILTTTWNDLIQMEIKVKEKCDYPQRYHIDQTFTTPRLDLPQSNQYLTSKLTESKVHQNENKRKIMAQMIYHTFNHH